MALSATFTANFASFYTAVEKAERVLIDFGDGADKAGAKLARMTVSFSGQKVIQDATVMAQAVEDIGGASKLTERELAKLGATTNEAVTKMRLLGMDVPANLQAIADKTAAVNSKSTDWLGTLGKVASTVGIAFSVGAITSFISGLVESASHIQDVADKLDVSTDAAQRWEYAVNLSGGTIDDVSKSLVAMENHLAGGSDSVVAALNAAGLEFSTIRDIAPEVAFEQIATAIKGVKDPMEQVRIATELFGKAGVELLPAIRDGIVEIGEKAPVMSRDTIEAFDMLGDAWTYTSTAIKSQFAEYITGPFREWKDMIGTIRNDLSGLPAVVANLKTPDLFKNPELTIGKTGDELDALMRASQKLNTETENTINKSAEASRKFQEQVNILTGQGLIAQVADLTAKYQAAEAQGGATAYQIGLMAKAAAELKKQGAILTPVLEDLVLGARILEFNSKAVVGTTGMMTRSLKDWTSEVVTAKPKLDGYNLEVEKLAKLGADGRIRQLGLDVKDLGVHVSALPPPPIDKWHQFKDDAKQTLDNLAFDVAQTTVTLIGHWSHWRDVTKQIWEQVQGAISRILGDILYEFEKQFIGGMVKAIVGAKLGETIGNQLAGGVSGHYAQLGRSAGSQWVSAFAQASIYGLIAYGLYEAFFNEGPGDPHVSPGESTGYVDYGTGSGAAGGDNPNLGGGQGSDSGSTDAGVSMPNLPGYARGTGGRYLDFGAGTPVMLHGREAVVPLDAAQSAAPTTIVVQTILDGRQIAEAIFPYTPQVAMRHRVATR